MPKPLDWYCPDDPDCCRMATHGGGHIRGCRHCEVTDHVTKDCRHYVASRDQEENAAMPDTGAGS